MRARLADYLLACAIGAYIVGVTDDVRNVACGMQTVIVGAFCWAIANGR